MAFKIPFINFVLLASLAIASPVKRTSTPLATVYSSCTLPNTVAITFDDGPYEYNQQISDLLTSHNAKGTFFFNGNNWACIYDSASIARVQYVYAAGHQVASHTWSHADLATLTQTQIADGMYRTEEAISRIIGVKPAFMRPPYGSYNDDVRTVAASRGQALAIWDWDSGDADGNSTAQSEALYQTAVDDKVKNMLVLNHETEEGTAETVIPFAIQLLQSKGYKLVTMAECLGVQPYLQIGSPQTQTADWTCSGQPLPGEACDGTTIPCKTAQINVNQPTSGGGGSTTSTTTTTSKPSGPTTTTTTTTPSGPTGINTARSNIQIHPSASSSKCLTAASNSNNAAVEIEDCIDASPNQLWSITPTGLSIFSGSMCLDVTSGSATDGNKMQIYPCSNGNSNQDWLVNSSSGGKIQWSAHGSCLDLTGGNLGDGNVVQIWTCTSGPNQSWTISNPPTSTPPTSGSGQGIHPGASSSTCLTAASNSNNAAVTVQPCQAGNAAQQWTKNPTTNGSGTLSIFGSKCLDVPSGSTANGVKLQIYDCSNNGNANQQWFVTGDNRIAWTNKGECMDLTGGSLTGGNAIQMWACGTGNNNQVWKFA